jgi:hypothetical protein
MSKTLKQNFALMLEFIEEKNLEKEFEEFLIRKGWKPKSS